MVNVRDNNEFAKLMILAAEQSYLGNSAFGQQLGEGSLMPFSLDTQGYQVMTTIDDLVDPGGAKTGFKAVAGKHGVRPCLLPPTQQSPD